MNTKAAIILISMAALDAVAGTRTTADGVYTAEQASRGLEVHQAHCARCHDRSYYQGDFLAAWQNVPVSALYDVIEMKMPEDRPGALEPRQYAALLAYVFELNGLPAGEQVLKADREVMEEILIEGR